MQILPMSDYRANAPNLHYVACLMEEILPLTEITRSMDEILNDAVTCTIMNRALYGNDNHRYIHYPDHESTSIPHVAVYAAFTSAVNVQGRNQLFPKIKMNTEYLPLEFTDQEAANHNGARMAMIMNHRTKDYPTWSCSTNTTPVLQASKTEDGLWCYAEYDLGAPASLDSIGASCQISSNTSSSTFHAPKTTVVQALIGEVWTDVNNALDGTITGTETVNAVNVVAQKFRVVAKTIPFGDTKVLSPLFGIKFYGTYVGGTAPRTVTKPKHMILANMSFSTFIASQIPNVNENSPVQTRDRLVAMYGFSVTDVITETPTTDVFVPELAYKAGVENVVPHFNVKAGVITGEGV